MLVDPGSITLAETIRTRFCLFGSGIEEVASHSASYRERMLFEQEERVDASLETGFGSRTLLSACQEPPTPQSCIFSHLKLPVDGSNCAPAARHAVGNFGDGHIAIREEPHDSFYLLFTERTALSSHIHKASTAFSKEY